MLIKPQNLTKPYTVTRKKRVSRKKSCDTWRDSVWRDQLTKFNVFPISVAVGVFGEGEIRTKTFKILSRNVGGKYVIKAKSFSK